MKRIAGEGARFAVSKLAKDLPDAGKAAATYAAKASKAPVASASKAAPQHSGPNPFSDGLMKFKATARFSAAGPIPGGAIDGRQKRPVTTIGEAQRGQVFDPFNKKTGTADTPLSSSMRLESVNHTSLNSLAAFMQANPDYQSELDHTETDEATGVQIAKFAEGELFSFNVDASNPEHLVAATRMMAQHSGEKPSTLLNMTIAKNVIVQETGPDRSQVNAELNAKAASAGAAARKALGISGPHVNVVITHEKNPKLRPDDVIAAHEKAGFTLVADPESDAEIDHGEYKKQIEAGEVTATLGIVEDAGRRDNAFSYKPTVLVFKETA